MNNATKRMSPVLRLTYSAICLALCLVLPFLTGQIPEIGAKLCPMHIPVLLCGFFCGWPWGLAVGFIAPLMRSLLTGGFPPMFPTAVCMAFELAAYGAVAGAMHRILPRKKPYIYCSLLSAMIIGRLIWGAAMFLCVGISGSFTFAAFLAGAVTNAIPGILVQLVVIPILVAMLDHFISTKAGD